MKRITTLAELLALKRELGVRDDWHEPDEQDVTARWAGTEGDFDNAGFWGGRSYGSGGQEMYVVLHRLEKEVVPPGERPVGAAIACVNLATLFSWATGYECDAGDANTHRCTWEVNGERCVSYRGHSSRSRYHILGDGSRWRVLDDGRVVSLDG